MLLLDYQLTSVHVGAYIFFAQLFSCGSAKMSVSVGHFNLKKVMYGFYNTDFVFSLSARSVVFTPKNRTTSDRKVPRHKISLKLCIKYRVSLAFLRKNIVNHKSVVKKFNINFNSRDLCVINTYIFIKHITAQARTYVHMSLRNVHNSTPRPRVSSSLYNLPATFLDCTLTSGNINRDTNDGLRIFKLNHVVVHI